MHKAVVLFSLPLALMIVVGCGGKSTSTPTSTMEDTSTVAATVTPANTTPLPDLRNQDWSRQSDVQAYLSTAGGQVDAAGIIYADLTQDGIDDAVVPIGSGGESGDIALFVFGYVDGSLKELLHQGTDTSIRATVDQGVLRTMESVFGPGDPRCCPSQVRTTTYRWNGTALVVGEQNTGPATP